MPQVPKWLWGSLRLSYIHRFPAPPISRSGFSYFFLFLPNNPGVNEGATALIFPDLVWHILEVFYFVIFHNFGSLVFVPFICFFKNLFLIKLPVKSLCCFLCLLIFQFFRFRLLDTETTVSSFSDIFAGK